MADHPEPKSKKRMPLTPLRKFSYSEPTDSSQSAKCCHHGNSSKQLLSDAGPDMHDDFSDNDVMIVDEKPPHSIKKPLVSSLLLESKPISQTCSSDYSENVASNAKTVARSNEYKEIYRREKTAERSKLERNISASICSVPSRERNLVSSVHTDHSENVASAITLDENFTNKTKSSQPTIPKGYGTQNTTPFSPILVKSQYMEDVSNFRTEGNWNVKFSKEGEILDSRQSHVRTRSSQSENGNNIMKGIYKLERGYREASTEEKVEVIDLTFDSDETYLPSSYEASTEDIINSQNSITEVQYHGDRNISPPSCSGTQNLLENLLLHKTALSPSCDSVESEKSEYSDVEIIPDTPRKVK